MLSFFWGPRAEREFLGFEKVALSALVTCLLLFQSGCGDGRPSRVPISGQVTIDGEPLKFGSILFLPESGRASGGSLDENGRYELTSFEKGDGATVGSYSVAITGTEQLGETAQRWHAPEKYSNPKESGLNATIDGPRDDLNFELTWDGGKPYVQKF